MQIVPDLTTRARYRLAIFLWFVNGAALGLGALYLSEYFLIPLFLLLAIVGFYAMSLKCQTCGHRVLYNPVTILGVKLRMWTSWIPKRCSNCSTDIP